MCSRNQQVLGEGPAALMHRIIDQMVDNYRPESRSLRSGSMSSSSRCSNGRPPI